MNNTGKLFSVATPIGNLDDISVRTLKIFEQTNIFFCEDTRKTKKLLGLLEVDFSEKRFFALDARKSRTERVEKLKKFLRSGKNVVYAVDAGTPNISDPGVFMRDLLAENIPIVSIPGSSSLTAFLSICGLSGQKFSFLGFLPKKGNKKFELMKILLENVDTIVFFEGTHRVKSTVQKLKECFEGQENICISIGQELTKLHEKIYFGSLKDFDTEKIVEKGEFVIGIGKLKI